MEIPSCRLFTFYEFLRYENREADLSETLSVCSIRDYVTPPVMTDLFIASEVGNPQVMTMVFNFLIIIVGLGIIKDGKSFLFEDEN